MCNLEAARMGPLGTFLASRLLGFLIACLVIRPLNLRISIRFCFSWDLLLLVLGWLCLFSYNLLYE